MEAETTMAEEKVTKDEQKEPEGPQVLGADAFAPKESASVPEGAVFQTPQGAYLDAAGYRAWLKAEIARAEARTRDPDNSDLGGAYGRLTALRAELARVGRKAKLPFKRADDLAHPEQGPGIPQR